MLEIRWHARGGQGAVTAAKAFAEAALEEGKYIQAMPEYGPERSGAPIRAYNRVSPAPIRFHSQVTTPDVVVVVDSTLLGTEDLLAGTSETATLLINSGESPQAMRERLRIAGRKLYTLDASQIALEELGRNFPNTPLLGALARVTGEITLDGLERQVQRGLGKKVTPEVLRGNLRAVERGYEGVRGEDAPGVTS